MLCIYLTTCESLKKSNKQCASFMNFTRVLKHTINTIFSNCRDVAHVMLVMFLGMHVDGKVVFVPYASDLKDNGQWLKWFVVTLS